LFATHYHELTRLSSSIPLLANAHMAVETGMGIESRTSEFRFLYILKEGATNDSFGVHVAKLAGLPKAVIERAWKVLDELERSSIAASEPMADPQQLPLFLDLKREPVEPHPVLTQIGKLNPNEMTPLQALNWLSTLQEMSRESEPASSSKPNR
jgi:DNA mismatch repair protein MutS